MPLCVFECRLGAQLFTEIRARRERHAALSDRARVLSSTLEAVVCELECHSSCPVCFCCPLCRGSAATLAFGGSAILRPGPHLEVHAVLLYVYRVHAVFVGSVWLTAGRFRAG